MTTDREALCGKAASLFLRHLVREIQRNLVKFTDNFKQINKKQMNFKK